MYHSGIPSSRLQLYKGLSRRTVGSAAVVLLCRQGRRVVEQVYACQFSDTPSRDTEVASQSVDPLF